MSVVLSEDPIEAGSACSEFLGEDHQYHVARPTSAWMVLLTLIVFPALAIIECLPVTRTGWVVLAMALGPLVAVGAAALLAVYY